MPGLIGKADLAAGVWTQLGAALGTDGVVNVRFANRSAGEAAVSVALKTAAGDPGDVDIITPAVPVKGSRPYEDTAIAASAGEKVWVKASVAGVTARAHYV